MAASVHDLISRIYDVAFSRLSADKLMSELAEHFSANAAALIACRSSNPPKLICYGTGEHNGTGDPFYESLHGDLSRNIVDRLVKTSLSVTLDDLDDSSHILLIDAPGPGQWHHTDQENTALTLIPHIVRAIQLFSSIRRMHDESEEVADQLNDRLLPASIKLDSEGYIIAISEKADELLRSSSSVKKSGNRIEFRSIDLSNQFNTVLQELLQNPTAEPQFIRLQNLDEEDDLILLIKAYKEPRSGVTIFIRNMSNPPAVLAEHIAQKFALTHKETRLATGLMSGKSLRQLSAEFHVSIHTLRTQMKSVLRKTDVNSQAALIVLMLDHHSIMPD